MSIDDKELQWRIEESQDVQSDAMRNRTPTAELQDYAGPGYESTVRQNALANLLYLGNPDPVVLQNLVNATSHHKWQFSKFGRDNIRKLLKKEGYRSQFESLLPQLPEAERKRLEGILAE